MRLLFDAQDILALSGMAQLTVTMSVGFPSSCSSVGQSNSLQKRYRPASGREEISNNQLRLILIDMRMPQENHRQTNTPRVDN